ncbi:fimbria/pilus outer membrane usher protein [Pseudomonas oryzihabitans]|uniref:fimbria/pilus outer membrane usher protein n=1 Tax=Pseudomonas oryzihabitans TaxID=47885 RepID=UPI002856189E|nr:fimbria/pilus outer membrane usher protein [Pseudomonas psychrotolerans]MDR6680382.1 outer membrane usher protein FimD/PapC [Pseudomonas psychrotolerans]
MSPALAQAQLQFDKTLLQANGIGSQKLEDALNDNKLYPNENSVSLYVNDHSFGQDHVFLFPNGAVGFDQATLERIGLKNSAITQTRVHDGKTYAVLAAPITRIFSRSDRSLRLTIPPGLLKNPDFIQEKSGGVGAFLNYDTYYYGYQGKTLDSRSLNANYELGANVGNTLLRSRGTLSSFSSSRYSSRRQSLQTLYLDRDFDFGTLKGGRLNSPDGGFGVGYVDGVVYSSSNQISGAGSVAFNYDATDWSVVEFYQNEQLIYRVNINKGHTELGAIPVISLTSDVLVLVKRNGQVVDSRVITRAQISRSSGHDSGFYGFVGRTRYNEREVTAGAGYTRSYGKLLNPTAAVIAQKHYRGVSLSNFATLDKAQLTTYALLATNEKGETGLNFSGALSVGNTDLSFQATSRTFSYIGQASLEGYRPDTKGSLGLSHTFLLPHGNAINLSLNRYSFYDRKGYNAVSLGYSTHIRKASLSLSAGYMTQNQVVGDTLDRLSLNATLSIPLNIGNHRSYYRSQYTSYNGRHNLDNYVTTQVTEDYSLSAGQRRVTGSGESTEHYLNQELATPYAQTSLSLSQAQGEHELSRSMSGALSGAVAVTRQGVIFSPDHVKDTYAVVDTHLKAFVKVDSLRGRVTTNHDGKALIPDIPAYRADFIKVNPEGLGDDTYFSNNRQEFISKRGSVAHFDFAPESNGSVLLKWLDKPRAFDAQSQFYDAQGNYLASFIDHDVLLVKKDDLKTLRQTGMVYAADNGLVCTLLNLPEDFHEQILNARFSCTGHLQKVPDRSPAQQLVAAGSRGHTTQDLGDPDRQGAHRVEHRPDQQGEGSRVAL